MKWLFRTYLAALAASGLMALAGPSAMDTFREQQPQIYWALAGLAVWTVNGGWFWVLIAWMVYRFTQRKTEATPPPLPLSSSKRP